MLILFFQSFATMALADNFIHLNSSGNTSGAALAPTDWNGQCENFISANGKLGPWGEVINRELNDSQNGGLLENGIVDAANVCPSWDGMSKAEKKEFWVFLIGAMAFNESSCNPSAKNSRATHGVGVGLLQLNSASDCPGLTQADYRDPIENLKCGVFWLRQDFSNNRAFFGMNTHFQQNRVLGGSKTQEMLRGFNRCGFNGEATPANAMIIENRWNSNPKRRTTGRNSSR